jgi:hypothetical protein
MSHHFDTKSPQGNLDVYGSKLSNLFVLFFLDFIVSRQGSDHTGGDSTFEQQKLTIGWKFEGFFFDCTQYFKDK